MFLKRISFFQLCEIAVFKKSGICVEQIPGGFVSWDPWDLRTEIRNIYIKKRSKKEKERGRKEEENVKPVKAESKAAKGLAKLPKLASKI